MTWRPKLMKSEGTGRGLASAIRVYVLKRLGG